MRLHEIMGIEQNRKWGVCSLNDFRKASSSPCIYTLVVLTYLWCIQFLGLKSKQLNLHPERSPIKECLDSIYQLQGVEPEA